MEIYRHGRKRLYKPEFPADHLERQPDAAEARLSLSRLFKASGLKVVFALLSRPRLVNAPLREIASDSGVSLGTMAGIIEELKKRLYLVEDNHGARA